MIHKYVCAGPGCGAQITLDDEARTQHTVYPRGRGPLSGSYRPHDCPVRGTLWPPESTIDLHPLARRVPSAGSGQALSGAEGKLS